MSRPPDSAIGTARIARRLLDALSSASIEGGVMAVVRDLLTEIADEVISIDGHDVLGHVGAAIGFDRRGAHEDYEMYREFAITSLDRALVEALDERPVEPEDPQAHLEDCLCPDGSTAPGCDECDGEHVQPSLFADPTNRKEDQ